MPQVHATLYLFAGMKREGRLGAQLEDLSKGVGLEVHAVELGVPSGTDSWGGDKETPAKILNQVTWADSHGGCGIATMLNISRARWATAQGPHPLRSAAYQATACI